MIALAELCRQGWQTRAAMTVSRSIEARNARCNPRRRADYLTLPSADMCENGYLSKVPPHHFVRRDHENEPPVAAIKAAAQRG